MDDENGTGNGSSGEQNPDPIKSAAALAEQKEPHESAETNANKGGGKNGVRNYWRELLKEGPDRHIELLLTIAIATFALFQLLITCSNNASTTRQVDRIITTADRIDDAADSFSGSAARINQGIAAAVTQLDIQAGASKTQAGASKTLAGITAKQFSFNQQMAESQRAAISIELYQVLNPVTFHDRGLSLAFSALLTNNGQIRAVGTVVRFKPSYIQWGPDDLTEPAKRQAALCDKPPTADEVKQATELAIGDVIFAGAHKETQINFGMGAPTQEEIIKWPPDSAYKQNPALTLPQTDRVHPIVVGCVDYGSGSIPGKHQAGFIFDVEKTGDDSSLPTFIKLGEDVARGNVVITKYFFSQGKNY